MAMMFPGGTSASMLCIVLNTKPLRIDSPLPTDIQVCYGGPSEETE